MASGTEVDDVAGSLPVASAPTGSATTRRSHDRGVGRLVAQLLKEPPAQRLPTRSRSCNAAERPSIAVADRLLQTRNVSAPSFEDVVDPLPFRGPEHRAHALESHRCLRTPVPSATWGPRLPQPARSRCPFSPWHHRRGRPFSIRRPESRTQQMLGNTNYVPGAVAVAFVVAVQESPFLLPMQRIIRGVIQVQDQLLRRLRVRFQAEHPQPARASSILGQRRPRSFLYGGLDFGPSTGSAPAGSGCSCPNQLASSATDSQLAGTGRSGRARSHSERQQPVPGTTRRDR